MPLPNGIALFMQILANHHVNPVDLIAESARWVDPRMFQALPVAFPHAARGLPAFNVQWQPATRTETNEHANLALYKALGERRRNDRSWTVCHLWDCFVEQRNVVVTDRRYYTCLANMVLLPTPLKALTDSVPEIKYALRFRSYQLYGWCCDYPDPQVLNEANRIANLAHNGDFPAHWPAIWSAAPAAPASQVPQVVLDWVNARKESITQLCHAAPENYPVTEVRQVLTHWLQKREILDQSFVAFAERLLG